MADKPVTDATNGQVKECSPKSPEADYGLSNDYGFDPSKYDFYNPSYGTARKAFVVRLNTRHPISDPTSDESLPTHFDPYKVDTPPPLSPIDELDDDPNISRPRHNSDPGLAAAVKADGTKLSDTDFANPINEKERDDSVRPLEQRSQLLFSRQHLQLILADPHLSLRFSDFLRTYRPDSVPILIYYLDTVKALKAIKYAEAIIKGLEPIPGHTFTAETNSATMAWVMEDKADRALDVLLKDDLPAFIAYIYVRTVDLALVDRVTGKEDPKFRSIADGLAEVFVLSDPSRPDNPIVFTSEEFHRMTGYPRSEFIGRNCRSLGGPRTSTIGINRFRASLDAEREHCEVLLNYRKDGSPFVNLIMCVPLRDQNAKVRYYLGAQLDITDLVIECTGLVSLKKLVEQPSQHRGLASKGDMSAEILQQDEFEQLSEAFNPQELEKLVTLRQRQQLRYEEGIVYSDSAKPKKDGLPLRTSLADLNDGFRFNGQGSIPPLGYYKTYLLVRPYPSLRILFASPDLQIPGILQSPLLGRIGGSARVREDLARALEVGRKVTAKVQWLSTLGPRSQSRWIHCTPLLGANDAIGVWMVILVEDEDDGEGDRRHASPKPSRRNRLGSNYTAEALPWDAERPKTNSIGVSTRIWSETDGSRKRADENARPKPRRPLFRQPTDVTVDSIQIPSVRPHLAENAYSSSSTSDPGTSIDDSRSVGVDADRPLSRGSTIIPIQSTMQPKVRIAGRPSMDGESARKPPINTPGRRGVSGVGGMDGEPPARRTYKSLSPYGILFED